MKTTDLILGSYVKVKPSGMIIKVAAIHQKKVGYHSCQSKLEWVRRDLIEPIPLTPEILEKNGFERRDDLVVDDNFLPFILERLDTDECFEITVYWRDSYSNGAADAFNEVSWDEYWKLHILSGPSLYEYETGNCIYVHELQHALKDCKIKKKIKL